MFVPQSLGGDAYVATLLLAILVGIWFAIREGDTHGLERSTWLLLIGLVAMASIVGSKFVFFDLSAPAVGKKSNLGGIVSGVVVACLVAYALHLSVRRTLDAFTVPTLVGIAIGRVGCFLAGCCRGVESGLPWAVHYHDADAGVHPVQLYESAGDLLIVSWLVRTRTARSAGDRFALGVLAYAALRFSTEYLRAGRTTVYALNPVQWMVLLVFIAVAAWWMIHRRQHTIPTVHLHASEKVNSSRIASITLTASGALLLTLWLFPRAFSLDEVVALLVLATALPIAVLASSSRRWPIVGRASFALPSLGAMLLLQVPDSAQRRPPDEVLLGGSTVFQPYYLILGEEEIPSGMGCDGVPLYRTTDVRTKRRTEAWSATLGWRRWFDRDRHLTVTGQAVRGTNRTAIPAYVYSTTTPHPLMSEVTPSIGLSGVGAAVAYSGGEADLEAGVLTGTFAQGGNATPLTLLSLTTRIGTRGGVYVEGHVANTKALEAIGDFAYGGVGYTFGLNRPRLMVGLGSGPVVNVHAPTRYIELDVAYRATSGSREPLVSSRMWQIGGVHRWRR